MCLCGRGTSDSDFANFVGRKSRGKPCRAPGPRNVRFLIQAFIKKGAGKHREAVGRAGRTREGLREAPGSPAGPQGSDMIDSQYKPPLRKAPGRPGRPQGQASPRRGPGKPRQPWPSRPGLGNGRFLIQTSIKKGTGKPREAPETAGQPREAFGEAPGRLTGPQAGQGSEMFDSPYEP